MHHESEISKTATKHGTDHEVDARRACIDEYLNQHKNVVFMDSMSSGQFAVEGKGATGFMHVTIVSGCPERPVKPVTPQFPTRDYETIHWK
jgi:hypothetical protein